MTIRIALPARRNHIPVSARSYISVHDHIRFAEGGPSLLLGHTHD